MKSKFNDNNRVIIKKTKQLATIKKCCGTNYYLPEWMCIPAYFILIDGERDTIWIKQTKLKKL